jgi:signal transduction histidine kinase
MQSDAEVMLRKPRSNEEYRETIHRMLTETRRMSEMVHLLLHLSRVESDHSSESEIVNISRITEIAISKHHQNAEEKDITLNTSIDKNLHVRAHGAYIEEIFNNLLENALKYTPAGGRVDLKLLPSGGKAVIQLSDTGIGFDPETQKHLFERFYRANQRFVQESPGSGLGLSLMKAIVELYDGKISAYSDGPDNGSTFVVELPLVNQREA